MSELSYSDKELLKEAYGIFLVRGHLSSGEPFFIYAAVRLDRVETFKACFRKLDEAATKKLDECAKILTSGLGDPTPEAIHYIRDTYGIAPEAIVEVPL